MTFKVDLIVLVSLAVGVGAVVLVFASALVTSRDSLSRGALVRQADLLAASVENFMLPGEAPIAVRFFEEVESTSRDTRVRLLRASGARAFSDGTTVARVNAIIGKERFEPRAGPPSIPDPPPRFAEAAGSPPAELFFNESEAGRSYYRTFRPLLNLPKCVRCHGSDHTLRGVIDVRVDATEVALAQSRTVTASGGSFLAVVAFLALILGAFLRRVVLEPVGAIGRLCGEVTAGRFEGRVEATRRDEIGDLGRTVNQMVLGLKERSELSKYVSAGTLDSLSGAGAPSRVERTLLFSDVRGFTAYTERNDPERVVASLNRVLEGQARIVREEGGDVDKFVGDEVVAVFEGPESAVRACAAANRIRARVEGAGTEFDGLRVGIGLATGSVIRGMIGSEERADFTVMGDSVNTASRLCSIAKAGQVLACETTRSRSGGSASFKGPYGVELKGKAGKQRVYLLLRGDGEGGGDGSA
ncbi:MAG: HAMP domain-containing protein [Spirochaetaceae bacterium]|nr:HAMP domain-containing protein [Spirochaetaceae bacterium]